MDGCVAVAVAEAEAVAVAVAEAVAVAVAVLSLSAQLTSSLSTPKLVSHFPAKCVKIIELSSILWPHGILNRIFSDPPETQHFGQNRPWVPHAGGQDDGSLHKLPQTIPLPPFCGDRSEGKP